jgi:hypothetical protein
MFSSNNEVKTELLITLCLTIKYCSNLEFTGQFINFSDFQTT